MTSFIHEVILYPNITRTLSIWYKPGYNRNLHKNIGPGGVLASPRGHRSRQHRAILLSVLEFLIDRRKALNPWEFQ